MVLKRELTLFDAVNISLGTIIGAGIFVIIGEAAALAGPAIFLSVIVAGIVAGLTGYTSSKLSEMFPQGGGVYTFAKDVFSERIAFLVGWVWLVSNVLVGATVAVGFGHYLQYFLPSVPVNLAAAFIIILISGVTLLGAGRSSKFNDILVVIKILILVFFIAAAGPFFSASNFVPLAPFGIEGILEGAAIIFFAYSGFVRVAVVADEVKNPRKNVPRAIMLSIIISTIIYILVSIAAVGAAGYGTIAGIGFPLTAVMEFIGFGSAVVASGALIATTTVVLASIIGTSVLTYIMGNAGELPAVLGKVSGKERVPRNAIILLAATMLIIALFVDLKDIAYISSFSLLLYYGVMNLSGFRVLPRAGRLIALLAFISCLLLMASLSWIYWAAGLSVVAAGAAYHAIFVRKAAS
jgi:APA family basic amino acid/polyamine antiporter